jgi:hypothetical protein
LKDKSEGQGQKDGFKSAQVPILGLIVKTTLAILLISLSGSFLDLWHKIILN